MISEDCETRQKDASVKGLSHKINMEGQMHCSMCTETLTIFGINCVLQKKCLKGNTQVYM